MTDVPRYDEDSDTWTPPSQSGKYSCKHQWRLDEERTSIPEEGGLPALGSDAFVVAHCHNCRAHLTVILSYKGNPENHEFKPCPSKDAPLHHFVYAPTKSAPLPPHSNGAEPVKDADLQLFRCSSQTCGAKLYVSYTPARLLQRWVDQLTDRKAIADRHSRISRDAPSRFEGIGPPSAMDVLSNLREYLVNALADSKQRVVRSANKRFMLSFGDAPDDLFEYLGFERDVSLLPKILEDVLIPGKG